VYAYTPNGPPAQAPLAFDQGSRAAQLYAAPYGLFPATFDTTWRNKTGFGLEEGMVVQMDWNQDESTFTTSSGQPGSLGNPQNMFATCVVPTYERLVYTVSYSGLVAATPFAVGDIVTGGTSGETAQVIATDAGDPAGTIDVIRLSDTQFTASETIDGAPSGAQATADTFVGPRVTEYGIYGLVAEGQGVVADGDLVRVYLSGQVKAKLGNPVTKTASNALTVITGSPCLQINTLAGYPVLGIVLETGAPGIDRLTEIMWAGGLAAAHGRT
jgi:hypothetical protein